MKKTPAAIGFRAKTGRAIAVALSGTSASPNLIWRREISLVDPEIEETRFPYHATMELPWPRAMAATAPFVRAIEEVAVIALEELIRDLDSRGTVARAVGIVGSLDRDLAKLGSPHMRAHAAEGILFRRVLEHAAARHRLPVISFGEKTVNPSALSRLHISNAKLEAQLKALGAQAGSPWRSDQKLAATAGWIALAQEEK